jgi:UDP-GlcNAc:undecaprenyl-phosphate/decaprenyl-phosphate GlcNAc-1-phosphate transferase
MAAGLLAFFIALFASLALVVPVRALALRVGMVDLPGPRKVHLTPIPLLGGLAMYAAVVIAVLFAFNGPARAQIVGILIGATLVAAVGILDDRGLLHHQIKLFVGMPLAAAILLVSGIRAQVFSVLVGGRRGDFLMRSSRLFGLWELPPRSAFSITWTGCARVWRLWLPFFSRCWRT